VTPGSPTGVPIHGSRPGRFRLLRTSVALAVLIAVLGLPGHASAALLPAVANPDSGSVVSGAQRSVAAPGVLGNDLHLLGSYTADLVTDVSHGSLTFRSDGSYDYRSDAGYSGQDTFRYRILGSILGPSNTTMVTITVTAPPTPAPTPPPTPKPTAQPTVAPTPAPTARPTPVPTPRPTVGPIATVVPVPPVPSIDPLPTLPPLPTTLPTVRPSVRPSVIPTVIPTLIPAPSPTATSAPDATRAPDAAAGPIASPPRGGSGTTGGSGSTSGSDPGTAPRAPETPTFSVPESIVTGSGALDMDLAFTLRGFDWAIPALVLTVPGILLVLAIVTQALIGILWLPVTRRWLGGDRRRRVQSAAASSA
jgi:hypothetical protein